MMPTVVATETSAQRARTALMTILAPAPALGAQPDRLRLRAYGDVLVATPG